jgi:hypothetical protein
VKHMTDEEIQAYLDAPSGKADAGVRNHLGKCLECSKVLADYRALYSSLADDAAFEVPKGLAGAVLSRLRLQRKQPRQRLPGDLVIVASAIVAMIVGMVALGEFRLLLDCISSFVGPIVDFGLDCVKAAYSHAAGNEFVSTVLMTAVFILATTGFLDLVFKLKRLAHMRRQFR